jgi:quinol monooxygenase YgiN
LNPKSEKGSGPVVLATIRMIIPPKKHAEVLKILKAIAEQNRVLRGCLSCRIYKDIDEENAFVFEEMWRSEEDLKSHLRSKEYSQLLLVLEMALQHPEVKFNTITRQSGFETIEKARSSIPAQGSFD